MQQARGQHLKEVKAAEQAGANDGKDQRAVQRQTDVEHAVAQDGLGEAQVHRQRAQHAEHADPAVKVQVKQRAKIGREAGHVKERGTA